MARYDGQSLNKLRETLVVAENTRRTMRANRATESKPEIQLRKALWSAGLRGYRKNVKKLPGSPDIVFGPLKLAIFVNGCFWHGCTKCKRRYRAPKTNTKYWEAKIKGNQERDEHNRGLLEAMGFQVLVVWECEIKTEMNQIVNQIIKILDSKVE